MKQKNKQKKQGKKSKKPSVNLNLQGSDICTLALKKSCAGLVEFELCSKSWDIQTAHWGLKKLIKEHVKLNKPKIHNINKETNYIG